MEKTTHSEGEMAFKDFNKNLSFGSTPLGLHPGGPTWNWSYFIALWNDIKIQTVSFYKIIEPILEYFNIHRFLIH